MWARCGLQLLKHIILRAIRLVEAQQTQSVMREGIARSDVVIKTLQVLLPVTESTPATS
jgi:hypothetical protein